MVAATRQARLRYRENTDFMATTTFPTRDDFAELLNKSLGGENEIPPCGPLPTDIPDSGGAGERPVLDDYLPGGGGRARPGRGGAAVSR